MNRSRFRILLRSFSLFLAISSAWANRYGLDPDGMSYVDLARCYLRGDWHNALSSYWSPLYPWLLTIAMAAVHPSPELLIPLTHLVCLFQFIGILAGWEWLMREWEIDHGPPSEWLLVDTVGYLLVTWAGLQMGGVDFNSADDAVIALLLCSAALLVRITRNPATRGDYIWLGITMAFGFFAKAAFQTSIPAILLVVLIRSRRGFFYAAGTLALAVVPYIVPMSVVKGKLTINDTGRLNYAWQVTGYGVEGYKEEGHPAPPGIPHPIDRLVDSPRLISFAKHMVGTTPMHFDPVFWCEGYPVYVDWQRQWMVLRDNVPEMLEEFAICPALFLAVLVFPFGIRAIPGKLWETWYLVLPAATMMTAYCFVYVLSRYTCAPFTLFGFALIAAAWKIHVRKVVAAAGVVLIVGCCYYWSFEDEIFSVTATYREAIGTSRAADVDAIDIYHRMSQEGFQPGDWAGVIGLAPSAQFLQLLQGQEVATVPARLYQRDAEVGRPLDFTWETPDAFWAADTAARDHVLNAMRSVGAKWVFASQIPARADVSGWIPVTKEKDLREEATKRTFYFRRL